MFKLFIKVLSWAAITVLASCGSALTYGTIDQVCDANNWDEKVCADKTTLANRIRCSTVNVYNMTETGGTSDKPTYSGYSSTGFVISENRIVTAYHTVTNGSGITYMGFRYPEANGRGPLHRVKVIAADKLLDVAILKLLDDSVQLPPPLPVRATMPVVGEATWHIGHTVAIGYGQIIEEVVIRGSRLRALQTNSKAWFGDSGGPVVDEQGQVIGVISKISSVSGQVIFMPIVNFKHLL